METILVTGPNGNVGREVIKALSTRVHIRAAAYNVPEAHKLLGDSIEYAAFDFARPETFAPALAGVDRMFLLRPPAISNVNKYIVPAIEAARSAGVKHIVFLSIQGVENNRVVPHYRIERALRESGITWTFLRASFFMQNLNTTHRQEIRQHRIIAVPVGRSKTSFIDVRDIGAAAAKVLTEAGHENRAYTLTGAEALDYDQVAAILTQALGTTIHYSNPSLLEFIRVQRGQGRAWPALLVMAALYTITRFGNAAEITADSAQLLGRAPISFEQYARDYRSAWI